MTRWPGVSLLLSALALGALMVGAIVAMAEIRSGWAVALACVALVACTVAIAMILQRLLREQPDGKTEPTRSSMRWSIPAFAAIAVGALVVALVAARHDDVATATSSDTTAAATQTVREFLVAAYLDGDGESACGYLSAAEQARVAASGTSTSCRDVLNHPARPPQLAAITSLRGLRCPRARAQASTGAATVRLCGGVFRLRPATSLERSQFDAPPSYWRIASGVAALLQAGS